MLYTMIARCSLLAIILFEL